MRVNVGVRVSVCGVSRQDIRNIYIYVHAYQHHQVPRRQGCQAVLATWEGVGGLPSLVSFPSTVAHLLKRERELRRLSGCCRNILKLNLFQQLYYKEFPVPPYTV